jgi:hypothetical protein
MADIHDLLGRRFAFADGSTPDVTLVGGNVTTGVVRLHALDGTRQSVSMALFLRAYRKGSLVESELPGFVFDTPAHATAARIQAQRRNGILHPRQKHIDSVGVAGPNKTIRSHAEMLRGR